MLRSARATDLEEVFRIYMDPAVNPFMTWAPMSLEEFEPIFRATLATKALHIYEVDGNVAAAIRLERKAHRLNHITYIGGFGVCPKFHNRGLGSQVLKEVLEKLKHEGVKRVELVVECDNPRAIHLYEKFGFQKEGTLRRVFKREYEAGFLDNFYMSLLLD